MVLEIFSLSSRIFALYFYEVMKKSIKILFTLLFAWTMVFSASLACACSPKLEAHDCCKKSKTSEQEVKATQEIQNTFPKLCHCPDQLKIATKENKLSEQDTFTVFKVAYLSSISDFQNENFFKKWQNYLQTTYKASPPNTPIFLNTHSFLL